MSMIKIENLTFSYPTSYDNVFENVSFQVDSDWKLGFVGRNGRGKTTFLNLLLGKYEYSGKILSSVQFDYFPYPISDKNRITEDILQEVCPLAEEWELMRELSYLDVDVDVLWRPFETLSNGEQTKVLLAALFLNEGHFLLIDEPTNHLVTEPISIKVIDPANSDISIIHRDNIPYQNDSEIIPTELILDKVVYEQGEPIYFKINGSWVRNRVCILKDDVFYTYNIKDAMESANQTRYAQHGTYYELVQKYKDNSNLTKDYRNFLNTEGLPPGQYKIVYLFGEELEKAWRHTVFGNPHNAAKSRVITIIDITILPNDAVQNHLAYTKTDGTQDKIALPELSLSQSIKEPTYTLTTLTETEYNAIYNTAKYSSNPNESYNYGTKDSLKYRFDNYKVKPAETTYTVTAPADVNTCTCNLTYYYTLLNCGERKRFNLLSPSYSFTKIEN